MITVGCLFERVGIWRLNRFSFSLKENEVQSHHFFLQLALFPTLPYTTNKSKRATLLRIIHFEYCNVFNLFGFIHFTDHRLEIMWRYKNKLLLLLSSRLYNRIQRDQSIRLIHKHIELIHNKERRFDNVSRRHNQRESDKRLLSSGQDFNVLHLTRFDLARRIHSNRQRNRVLLVIDRHASLRFPL